jgi:hypothetical protein
LITYTENHNFDLILIKNFVSRILAFYPAMLEHYWFFIGVIKSTINWSLQS